MISSELTDIIVTTLYTIICVVGLIGNIIVIYVILYTSSLDYATLNLYKKRLELSNFAKNYRVVSSNKKKSNGSINEANCNGTGE